MKIIKEKIIGATGSVSGVASILGSWQVCHTVCLGLIAVLGVLGITVVGMPLAFFTTIAVPMWSVAVLLLAATVILYLKKKCISSNLMIMNSGILFAGIPFQQIQSFQWFFWVVGGGVAITGLFLLIKEKMDKKVKRCVHHA